MDSWKLQDPESSGFYRFDEREEDESMEDSLPNRPWAAAVLWRALIAARQQCAATVHKDGWNKDQNYGYVGHEQVLTSGARAALLENGLALVQVATEFAGADTDRGGKPIWRWRGRFALLHVDGGTLDLSFEATTFPNDKAAFVASTALDRTAHLRVLELAGSDEENPEHDSNREPGEPKQRKARADAKAKKPAAAPKPASYWLSGHGKMVERAIKAGHKFADADEHGLRPPMLPIPVFSAQAKPDVAGKRYDEVKAGYLREVIFNADNFGDQSAAVRLWVSYLVAKHEVEKLAQQAEQEAAEQALGGATP